MVWGATAYDSRSPLIVMRGTLMGQRYVDDILQPHFCLVENSDQLLIKYASGCNRWMQEGMTDRRGRSHPPQCTTSREDRQLVRMTVTDRSVTSGT
ncbi:hypothetical protein TNCV_2119081 [Trichonephila clavipes]|nr:hypothetical protein TNCV_2119081 [Trichonephila clavipes]